MGFIGEPFGDNDYFQHTENINLIPVDKNTLVILYDVHSEAGEGVIEATLKWDPTAEEPSVIFRAAMVPRVTAELGFAGMNFMRGPTLYGILDQCPGTLQGGIESFHDARTAFVDIPGQSVIRNLLVPPVSVNTVIQDTLVENVPGGTQLIIDQPQGIAGYFSKIPDPGYEERTDLMLDYLNGSSANVRVRLAQKSVNLNDINPEALETTNLFYSAEMQAGQLEEFSYQLSIDCTDFETLYPPTQDGVVFVSDKASPQQSLYFLPIDNNISPIGPPIQLTDTVISNPENPCVSVGGRYVAFSADLYPNGSFSRVHLLDLYRGTIKRLTIDPFGSSHDLTPSLGPADTSFVMSTNRSGLYRLVVESTEDGLGCSTGNGLAIGNTPHWSPANAEIVFEQSGQLKLLDLTDSLVSSALTNTVVSRPRFSPDGSQIAFNTAAGISIIDRDGTDETAIISNASNPTWAGTSKLIVERHLDGDIDLYLVDILTQSIIRALTTSGDGVNAKEPSFVNN